MQTSSIFMLIRVLFYVRRGDIASKPYRLLRESGGNCIVDYLTLFDENSFICIQKEKKELWSDCVCWHAVNCWGIVRFRKVKGSFIGRKENIPASFSVHDFFSEIFGVNTSTRYAIFNLARNMNGKYFHCAKEQRLEDALTKMAKARKRFSNFSWKVLLATSCFAFGWNEIKDWILRLRQSGELAVCLLLFLNENLSQVLALLSRLRKASLRDLKKRNIGITLALYFLRRYKGSSRTR